MQRIAVVGLDQEKEFIMSQLMDFGAVELVDQKAKLTEEDWGYMVTLDESYGKDADLDAKILKAETSLRFLEKYDSAKGPLFKTRRRVDSEQLSQINVQKEETETTIEEILRLEDTLRETKEKINKLSQDEIFLEPWKNYNLPLELQKTSKALFCTGAVPISWDMSVLMKETEEIGGVVMKVISTDRDLNYIAFVSLISKEEQVMAVLKKKGFSTISFKGFKGTVGENLARISEEKSALETEVKAIEEKAANLAHLRHCIEEYSDIITIEADKEKIKTKLLKTKKSFYLEGWIPTRLIPKAKELLEGMSCCYGFEEPKEEDEVPVLLDNKDFFVPFESITEMYSLPAYRGFDPTSIYALFYAVFFGMMLSDAGYGIIMALGCFVVLRKFNLEGGTYKMIKLFFYCGISTIIWGALFGGWFGDFVQVFARTILGKEVTIAPLWFNPLDDPMKLLIFSLALGIIHLFIGMGIKAYTQIKDGHWFDALCDVGFWYFTIIGLISWLGGGMISDALPTIGKWLAIIGAAGLLLTGGRHNKGFGKITGGLGNIYNVTGYMSDILSYARLLALGLATGVIAQVVNTMGSLFGGGIFGLIALLVIFVFGHTLNIAINALGAFIHASRLQYVEFFGKFYEDGGEPFNPFRKKTKYIRIDQEEEENEYDRW